jgi:hypothetical protein
MFSKKLYVLTLLFVGISLGAVEIEYIDVAQQWSLDCGAHAFKNAILGIELLQSEDDPARESEVRSRIESYPEYKKMTAFMGKKISLNDLELGKYVESQGVQDVYYFDYRRVVDSNSLNFWMYNSNGLRELLKPSYIKSFIIHSGTKHLIACTIEKTDGVITRVISMDSLRWKPFKMLGKVFKLLGGNVVSEQEAVQKVVDFANDQELVEQAQLYDRYQRCLKMVKGIMSSFYTVGDLFNDYNLQQYDQEAVLSEDLITDFTRRFAEYVQNMPVGDDSTDGLTSYQVRRNERGHLLYLSKIEFLEMFLPGSAWWTDASLFADENTPPDFTEEERAEMIELMNLDELLAEARGSAEQAEEVAQVEEPLEESKAAELSDSSSEEKSTEESKGAEE